MNAILPFTKIAQAIKNLPVIGCKDDNFRIVPLKNRLF